MTFSRQLPSRLALCFCVALFLFSFAHAAGAAPQSVPVTQMQVLARIIDDRTEISLYAASDSGAKLPYELELIVPKEFKVLSVVEINTSNPGTPLGEPSYTQGGKGDDLTYKVLLKKGNGVRFDFLSPSVVFKSSEGHVVGSLGLVAPADMSSLIYGFSAPKNMVGRGNDLISFGQDELGNTIFGKELKDVKKGERAAVNVAFVPVPKAGSTAPIAKNDTLISSLGALFVDAPWASGLVIVLAMCIIILVVVIVQKTRANAHLQSDSAPDDVDPDELDENVDDDADDSTSVADDDAGEDANE